MVKIILVVATDNQYSIGFKGKLVWHIPEDLKFFKNQTWGMPVLMGRKTFESINNKILKGRMNIILTNNRSLKIENGFVVHSIQESIDLVIKYGYKELYIIGGAEIYNLTLPIADKIIRTKIDALFTGDAFFPKIDLQEFRIIENIPIIKNETQLYNLNFEFWERIPKKI